MLNERQQEAVNKIEGPLLIIAGAGSGKTSTLTARVNHMIRNEGIHPESIMCVTFTNKAGSEMKERIAGVLGRGIPRYLGARDFPLIGTFHSIGVFILRQEIDKIGYKKDFVILDEQDKLSVVKEICKSKQLDDKVYPARNISFHISNAKNSLITPQTYASQAQNDFTKIVAEVFDKYEKRLHQLNALDFDDILLKTLTILKNPEILDKYQEKYKYLMVDEYQDTNAPQYNIVKLLASKYRNLAVVGDDWQSIYSWRGADMTNILNFKKDYKEALIVKLEQNYRSTKAIINSANAIIKNNKTALDKTLFTDNVDGEKIKYIEAFDDKAEARDVAEHIIDAGGSYKDNLVLYRTNSQSRSIEEALIKKGIPYRVIGGQKFYERKEIKDLLGYLKIVHNPADAVSMNRVINTPSRKIGAKSVEIINNYVNEYGLAYDDVIENVEEIPELKPAAKASVTGFNAIYKILLSASNQIPVEELIKLVVKKTSYKDYIKAQYPSKEEREAKLENISELINVASEYTGLEPRESLANFLEDVALLTDMDKNEEGGDNKVTLMTVHTSKGLEYDRVFVTGLEEGIFPHVRSLSNPTELEEERRLMYVAITRAKKEVFISRARERYSFGQYSQNPASRFIKEIPEENLEKLKVEQKSYFGNSFVNKGGLINDFGPLNKASSPITKSRINNVLDFSMGDNVEHPKFGIGKIVAIRDELGEIRFKEGTKKMSLKIAPIKKI